MTDVVAPGASAIVDTWFDEITQKANRVGTSLGRTLQSADVTANSTTQVFHSSLKKTVTAYAGEVLEATFSGALRGDTLANYAVIRIYAQSGTDVSDAAGTRLNGGQKVLHSADATNRINDCNLIGQYTVPADGQYTVGVSIARAGGSGTVTLDYANGNESILAVKVVDN